MDKALASLPPSLANPLLRLATSLPRALSSTPVKTAGALAVLITLNRYLSRRAINNGSLSHPWDWRREVVLITGGSSGLGELCARKLAARGVQVVVLDLRPPKKPLPDSVRFYQADVTSPEQVRAAAEQIRRDVGDPTVLVNNAGVGFGMAVLETTEQQVRTTFDVNIVSHFWTVREFLPAMVKRDHGHVVTIASAASFVTVAGMTDYGCSKAGLISFHEGLTQELRHWYKAPNVRTSIVHPTWTRTPLLDRLANSGRLHDVMLTADEVCEAIVKQILKGESGRVVLASRLSGLLPIVRAFPDWMQEKLRDSRQGLLAGNRPGEPGARP